MRTAAAACLLTAALTAACAGVDVVTTEEAAFTEAVKSSGQFCEKGTDSKTTMDGHKAFTCQLQNGELFAAFIAKDAAEAQRTIDLYRTAQPQMTYNVVTYEDLVLVASHGKPTG